MKYKTMIYLHDKILSNKKIQNRNKFYQNFINIKNSVDVRTQDPEFFWITIKFKTSA